jgi:hypothetical protein
MNATAQASAWVIFSVIALLWGIVVVLALDTHIDPDDTKPTEEPDE